MKIKFDMALSSNYELQMFSSKNKSVPLFENWLNNGYFENVGNSAGKM